MHCIFCISKLLSSWVACIPFKRSEVFIPQQTIFFFAVFIPQKNIICLYIRTCLDVFMFAKGVMTNRLPKAVYQDVLAVSWFSHFIALLETFIVFYFVQTIFFFMLCHGLLYWVRGIDSLCSRKKFFFPFPWLPVAVNLRLDKIKHSVCY